MKSSLSCERGSRTELHLYAGSVGKNHATLLEYKWNSFEATAFTRQIQNYLSDEEYRDLQDLLAQNPRLGEMIQGTGGFRKMRWSDERRGKGKRGGLRLIYFHFAKMARSGCSRFMVRMKLPT